MSRIEEIETRKAEIRELMNGETAELDLDALTEEVRALNAEIETIKADAAKAAELRSMVATGAGDVVEIAEIVTEETRKENTMTNIEMRKAPEYIDLYADYIKTGRVDEIRTSPFAPLLSENATGGTVPVPVFVEDIVRTAWEKDGITSLVRKAYIKGNLKVGFEISGDGANNHVEGADRLTEEELTLGVCTLTPQSIKKWIDCEIAA